MPSITRTTLAISMLISLSGCTGPRGHVRFDTSEHGGNEAAVRVADDPVGYIRATAQRCADIAAYEVEFYRQERVGMFVKSLKDEQHSHVKFQADPLRIRMDMLDEDNEFLAVAYVEGHNDDKLRCHYRKGAFGGEGAIKDYDPDFAVKFGRSQSPITDFGVARLLARILKTHDDMSAKDMAPEVEYVGLSKVEHSGKPAHHIRLTYDPSTGLQRTKVDLLIDPQTELPTACYLWQHDGDLDAKYTYIDFELRDEIPLEEFLIEG